MSEPIDESYRANQYVKPSSYCVVGRMKNVIVFYASIKKMEVEDTSSSTSRDATLYIHSAMGDCAPDKLALAYDSWEEAMKTMHFIAGCKQAWEEHLATLRQTKE